MENTTDHSLSLSRHSLFPSERMAASASDTYHSILNSSLASTNVFFPFPAPPHYKISFYRSHTRMGPQLSSFSFSFPDSSSSKYAHHHHHHHHDTHTFFVPPKNILTESRQYCINRNEMSVKGRSKG